MSVDRTDPNGIDERSFRFLRDVLTFVDTIRKEPKTIRIIDYLTFDVCPLPFDLRGPP
jgi:hypothetical protein